MSFIGKIPANAALTASDLADDIITLAKMAGGTDGNVITYDASGNPVAIATGSDGQVLTSAGAGAPPAFEAAAAGANTPAFFVRQSSAQDIAYNTATQLVFATEVYDTNSAFTSNTFTVPSGEGGTYFIYGRLGWLTANDFDKFYFKVYVNDSSVDDGAINSNFNQNTTTFNYSLALSAADTVKAYAYHNYSASNLITYAAITNFGGYKLIT